MLGRVGVCAVHSATRQTNTASFSIVEFSAEPKTLAYTSYRSYDAGPGYGQYGSLISHASMFEVHAHARY